MNDEELRAFLDSATVGGDDDQGKDTGADDGVEQARPSGETAGAQAKKGVPSFEELMRMADPQQEAEALPKSVALPKSEATVEPKATLEEMLAEAEPAQPKPPAEWEQTYAQEEEELVPLILPGFSPAVSPKRDLPPVFQPETTPEIALSDAPLEELEPTEEFDVVAFEQAEAQRVAENEAVSALETQPFVPVPEEPKTPATVVATQSQQVRETESVVPETDPFALLAPELAQPFSESEDAEYEPISVTGQEREKRKLPLPWLIVGGGAALALVASLFVVNAVRGADDTAPVETPETTSEPAPSQTSEPSQKPKPSEKPAEEPTVAPTVDPGSTYDLAITQWGITVPRSEAFGGSTPYTLFDGDSRAMFTLPLAESLSATCSQASKPEAWGLKKKDDGKLEVIRPEPRCSDAGDAAVYDKIWGLMDYMAKHPKDA